MCAIPILSLSLSLRRGSKLPDSCGLYERGRGRGQEGEYPAAGLPATA